MNKDEIIDQLQAEKAALKSELYWSKRKVEDIESETPLKIILGIIIAIGLLVLIQACTGAFKSPLKKLGINEDYIAEEYVKSYYPEYENCTMKYHNNFFICENVKIHCGVIDDRDGLTLGALNKRPTETIYFDNITLEEIFKMTYGEFVTTNE